MVTTTTMSPDELKKDVYGRGPTMLGKWMADILYNLNVARVPDVNRRRALIIKFSEVCVAVAKKIGAEAFFYSLAVERFPGDEAAQKMWVHALRILADLS